MLKENEKNGICRLIDGLQSEADVIKTMRPDGLTSKEEELIFALQHFAAERMQEAETASDFVEIDPDGENTFAVLGMSEEETNFLLHALNERLLAMHIQQMNLARDIAKRTLLGEEVDIVEEMRKTQDVAHHVIPMVDTIYPTLGKNPFAIFFAGVMFGNKLGLNI